MSLVKNKMTPELSLPSDLQEIKTKYDKLQKEYTHLQIESSKKTKQLKSFKTTFTYTSNQVQQNSHHQATSKSIGKSSFKRV